MKCERAMELLATGTALGRARAKHHLARCPGCAAEAARLAWFEDRMAAIEPLTAAQRALWTSASVEPKPRPAPVFWAGRARVAVAAAVCLVGIATAFFAMRPTPSKKPIESPLPPVALTEKPQRQVSPALMHDLDALTSDLHSLSRELATLSRSADLLDERRDAERLARRFVAMNTP